jgi:hypothetical protein
MRKRLGAKGGLGGNEFELLPSSNGGAPARDWSSLAAHKVRVSWGKDRGDLGVFIGGVSWKRGNEIRHFWRDRIGSREKTYAPRKLLPDLSDDVWVPWFRTKRKEKKKKGRAAGLLLLLGAAHTTRRTGFSSLALAR